MPDPMPEPTRVPVFAPGERERKAYECRHKDHAPPLRIFLLPDEDGTPRCPEHGTRMTRQQNRPYRRHG